MIVPAGTSSVARLLLVTPRCCFPGQSRLCHMHREGEKQIDPTFLYPNET